MEVWNLVQSREALSCNSFSPGSEWVVGRIDPLPAVPSRHSSAFRAATKSVTSHNRSVTPAAVAGVVSERAADLDEVVREAPE